MTIELVEPVLREPIPPALVDDPGATRFPARVPTAVWSVTTAGETRSRHG